MTEADEDDFDDPTRTGCWFLVFLAWVAAVVALVKVIVKLWNW